LLVLIIKKINPFFSLLIVSIITGLLLHMPLTAIISSVQNGVGSTLGSIALVIAFGAILGKWMEATGASHQIAQTLIKKFGVKNIQWATMLTGLITGVTMFYNAGFVVLVPLIFALSAETGLSLLYIGIPLIAALSVTHGLLPPHPSPVALASLFKANVGKTLLYGLIIGIPTIIVAGPLFGRTLQHIKATPSEKIFSLHSINKKELPSIFVSFFITLLPVVLILCCVILSFLFPSSFLKNYFSFFGEPTIAFLITLIVAFFILSKNKKINPSALMQWSVDGISGIAIIIMIIAAGGAFKQILIDGGVSEYIKNICAQLSFSPLILGWMVAAIIRISVGSATVAALTAAGIVAPLLSSSNVSPELMVLAVGSGSLMLSHVNDTGFWMFKEYFNLSVKQTFLSWSVMEVIVSVMGLTGVLILNMFIH
jgi:Gnt-I system high-affinity gluconate transporter